MFLEKAKLFIYIILFFIIFSLIIPIYSFAIDEDSIYVWSNNTSSVSTSISPSNDEQNENNNEEIENSR